MVIYKNGQWEEGEGKGRWYTNWASTLKWKVIEGQHVYGKLFHEDMTYVWEKLRKQARDNREELR